MDEKKDFLPNEIDPEEGDRLSMLLSNLSMGWKVSILREQPSWARGHLETIEYYGEDQEPIDIDYLIRRWGGRKLTLKIHNERGKWLGGGSVALFSYPPRVHGQVITEADVIGLGMNQNQYSQNQQWPSQHSPPPQSPPQSGLDTLKILELMSKQKGGGLDWTSAIKLAEMFSATRTQTTQPTHIQGGFDQMIQMMSAMKQMREFMSDFGGGGSDGGEDSILPLATEVTKALVSRTQQQNQTFHPPTRGALAPPKNWRPSPPVQNTNIVERPKQQNNGELTQPTQPTNTENKRQTVMQLAKAISELDPNDAAGCVALALDGMGEERGQKAMAAFFDMQNDGLDEDEETDDNS